MAEILVCQNRSLDPGNKGWWRDEDPVVIMPDGHQWGDEERNPAKFRIVKWPNRPVHSFKHLMDEGPDNSRRKWKIKSDGKAYDRKTGTPDPNG